MNVTLKAALAAQTRMMLNNAPTLPVIGNRYHSATLRRKASQALDSALEGYDAKAKEATDVFIDAETRVEGFRKELDAISDKPDAEKKAEFDLFVDGVDAEAKPKLEAVGKVSRLFKVGADGKRRGVVVVDDGSDVSVEFTDEQVELIKAVFLTDGPDWFLGDGAMVEAGEKFGAE